MNEEEFRDGLRGIILITVGVSLVCGFIAAAIMFLGSRGICP